MKSDKIKYPEGQWFAVPLRTGEYAIGIIVRGSYRTHGGLGYFFGPKSSDLPNETDTLDKKPNDAILITRFGDLGLVNGSWILIPGARPFSRDEWPVPKFGIEAQLIPEKGFIREYECNTIGEFRLVKEILVDISLIKNLPIDRISGGGSVEIRLTNLLKNI